MARKRRGSGSRKRVTGPEIRDEDYLDADTDIDESSKLRKRSQAEIKYRSSRKKKDALVVLLACISISLLISVYFLNSSSIFSSTTDDRNEDDGGSTVVDGSVENYDSELFVVSDVTNNWGNDSWHIMNYYGDTNFMLKIINTGFKEDTYILSVSNQISKLYFEFNENNFLLKPGRSKLVILNVSNGINYDYRVPVTSIKVNLRSARLKSDVDTVDIDLTIKDLDEDKKANQGDKISAFYTGTFLNGTLFDYSFRNPEDKNPLHVSLSDDIQTDEFEKIQYTTVIPGFKNGIIGMIPGETKAIIVPPGEGYPQDHELGQSTLIFQVRLLSNDYNK